MMNTLVYTFFTVAFSLIFFVLGWVSHSAYLPKKEKKVHKVSLLDTIKKDKVLNVVLLNAPSTYYIGPEGPQGFEYDLLSSYAKHLGVELNITAAHTVKNALALSTKKISISLLLLWQKHLCVNKNFILAHPILKCRNK